jgi:flagellar hook-associated protein 1
MTGITAVLLSGLTGLRAAQTGLEISSQNISNANTPGYVRTEVTLAPRTQLGAGGGVEVSGIRRAADRFLAAASYAAEAATGAARVRSDILARAQSSFGDPSGATSVFASLDNVWAALSEISVDPSSPLRRGDAIGALQTTYAEVRRIGQTLQDLIAEADQRIGVAVSDAQDLVNRISELNREIQLNQRSGADASGAQNAQSALIDQLSALMDVRATLQPDGSVHVRTNGGALLVGMEPARLSYAPSNALFASHGTIGINVDLGTQSNLEPFLVGGEIKGLLQARDQDLPALAEALGGLAGSLGDALNQVHNDSTATPAPAALIGRQTGLLATDAHGFTGTAVIGVVDSAGVLRQRLTIDFDAQTVTAEAPPAPLVFPAARSAISPAPSTRPWRRRRPPAARASPMACCR